MITEVLRRSYPLPNPDAVAARPPLSQHDEASPHIAPRCSETQDAAADLSERMRKVESTLDAIVRLMPQSDTRNSAEPQLPEEEDGYRGRFTSCNRATDGYFCRGHGFQGSCQRIQRQLGLAARKARTSRVTLLHERRKSVRSV